MIDVVKSLSEMSERSHEYNVKGLSLGLVPTMGALHKGHLSLVERSTAENDITVVSIFVNPTQFGPSEDLDTYPRDLEGDLKRLQAIDVDIVFAPSTDELYPEGYYTSVNVEGLTDTMCGAFRPGHFKGVATIVTKLFNIIRPTKAYFGQKDYQQAIVLKTVARDLNMGVDVRICPVVREEDGLAMSSRNAYMDADERRAAPVIYRSLKAVSDRLVQKELAVKNIKTELKRLLSSEPLVREIQYASVYDPVTLEEIQVGGKREEVLLAVALYIGSTRLIDNILVKV